MSFDLRKRPWNRTYSSSLAALLCFELAGCAMGAGESAPVEYETGQPAALAAVARRFGNMITWTGEFGDNGGWKDSPAYWETVQFADVNGDGLADVCGRHSDGIKCALSNGTSFGTVTLWSTLFRNSNGWANGPQYWQTIRFPDITGDGKADVCGRDSAGIRCQVSNGVSFVSGALAEQYSDANSWDSDPSYWQTIQFPDLNADGRADVCGRASAGMMCARSSLAGTPFFGPATVWTTEYSDALGWKTSPSHWQTIQFPDLNTSSGRADVCGRSVGGMICAFSSGSSFTSPSGWTAEFGNAGGWADNPAFWQTIQFPDLNGDTRADICGRATNSMICALSGGSSFGAALPWTNEYSNANGWADSPAYWQTIRFPDVNGDGQSDVCGRHSQGIRCALSDGNSLNNPSFWTADYNDLDGWGADPAYWRTIRFPDLNGDGASDVCGRFTDGVRCALAVP